MKEPLHKSDESYNVWISVSDLLSGLVFFFVILLLSFLLRYRNEEMRFDRVKQELEAPTVTRNQILSDLKDLLKQENLHVLLSQDEGILRLGEEALSFPEAKTSPVDEQLGNVAKIAHALYAVLSCYSTKGIQPQAEVLPSEPKPSWCKASGDVPLYTCRKNIAGTLETVMIEGHTDATNVRIRTGFKDNLSLSAERATNVWRMLKTCHPDLEVLFNPSGLPIIGVSGYASMRPIIKENPKDSRNRRIDLRFVMNSPDLR